MEAQEKVCLSCQEELDALLRFCPWCRFPQMMVAGKYRLIGRLGQGGTGHLYHAIHEGLSLDRERAIKVIPSDTFVKKEMARRFFREIEITALLSKQSQHIVQVYDDFGEEEGLGFFYVMELLKGQLLRVFLQKQGRLSLPMSLHILRQLCEAMKVAHRHQVLHRDLKPENLFLIERDDDPYFVKVIDFGITRLLGQTAQTTQGMIGTPAYMAPEQFVGQMINERSDIYAIGLIFHEMLTGEIPFVSEDDHMMAIGMRRLKEQPPSLADAYPALAIPQPISDLLFATLSPIPNERPATIQEFWSVLAPYLEEERRENKALLATPLSELSQKKSNLPGWEEKRATSKKTPLPSGVDFDALQNDLGGGREKQEESIPIPVDEEASLSKGSKTQKIAGTQKRTTHGSYIRSAFLGFFIVLSVAFIGWGAIHLLQEKSGNKKKREENISFSEKVEKKETSSDKGRIPDHAQGQKTEQTPQKLEKPKEVLRPSQEASEAEAKQRAEAEAKQRAEAEAKQWAETATRRQTEKKRRQAQQKAKYQRRNQEALAARVQRQKAHKERSLVLRKKQEERKERLRAKREAKKKNENAAVSSTKAGGGFASMDEAKKALYYSTGGYKDNTSYLIGVAEAYMYLLPRYEKAWPALRDKSSALPAAADHLERLKKDMGIEPSLVQAYRETAYRAAFLSVYEGNLHHHIQKMKEFPHHLYDVRNWLSNHDQIFLNLERSYRTKLTKEFQADHWLACGLLDMAVRKREIVRKLVGFHVQTDDPYRGDAYYEGALERYLKDYQSTILGHHREARRLMGRKRVLCPVRVMQGFRR
jgi:serine/threonine protein kinase